MIATGHYKHSWLGIAGIDINLAIAQYLGLEKPRGFLIWEVIPDSPADTAGLKGGTETVEIGGQQILIGGDVIVTIDNQTVRTLNDLAIYTERDKRPEDEVTLTIIRNDQQIKVDLTLAERPWPPPT